MLDEILELFGANKDRQSNIDTKNQRQGLLDHLELREWYDSLPRDKQRYVRESHNVTLIGGEEKNLLNQKMISSGDMSQQDFLSEIVKHAANEGNVEFAEEILPKALSTKGGSIKNEHFMYNSLIISYYKQRNNRDDAIEKCIEYCKKDIEIVDEFLESWDGEPPRIPSFKRLAIIYKKQKEYEKAIDVCDKAIERGLSDKTKTGFEGRRQRLLNKIDD